MALLVGLICVTRQCYSFPPPPIFLPVGPGTGRSGVLESKYLIHCFLYVKVQEVMQEPITEDTAKSFNVEKKLLDWCKERLKG